MVARPQVVATTEQIMGLQAVAQSNRRDEADRARAVLLSMDGWTSERLSVVFGVGADSIRWWRVWFSQGGVEALRASPAPGRSPAKGVMGSRSPRTARRKQHNSNSHNGYSTLPRCRGSGRSSKWVKKSRDCSAACVTVNLQYGGDSWYVPCRVRGIP